MDSFPQSKQAMYQLQMSGVLQLQEEHGT